MGTRPIPFPEQPKDPVVERRLQNLEKRSLTRPQIDQQEVLVPSGGGGGEITVAAFDSAPDMQARADFVCDDIDDDDTIAEALDVGNSVLLLDGSYAFGTWLQIGSAVTLRGQGRGTIIQSPVDCFEMTGNDSTIKDMTLVSGAVAIADLGSLHSMISGIETAAYLQAGAEAVVSDCVVGSLWLMENDGVVTNCRIADSLEFDSGSSRWRVSNCNIGDEAHTGLAMWDLDGTDNAVDACTIYGRQAVDNTGRLVRITGTRNSLTNCTLRNTHLTLRNAHAVEIEAGAVDARFRFNDLRPGVGTWGTGAIDDNGTGSLVSDNDS